MEKRCIGRPKGSGSKDDSLQLNHIADLLQDNRDMPVRKAIFAAMEKHGRSNAGSEPALIRRLERKWASEKHYYLRLARGRAQEEKERQMTHELMQVASHYHQVIERALSSQEF